MKFILLAAGLVSAVFALAAPVRAQEGRQENRQEGKQEAGPRHPGHVLVLSKCFQCHTDAMYRDLRQDRRAWEATVYRMIGRGALWTPEEVRLMADYLGNEYGPTGQSAAPPPSRAMSP
jgi:mono/diheme cytochrome c family protein